ncbi:MAG: hypothetical protein H7287_14595 [Thermoleophilia bacterium]|nr:hypothetical protein [Thermoleophilia bacterium]
MEHDDHEPSTGDAPQRVLLVSADVGGGHDAIAAAWTRTHRTTHPHADVTCCNGLEAMGERTRRFVRDGYARGLDYAPWIWTAFFRVFGSRLFAPLAWWFLPAMYRRRLQRVVARVQPDLVVSTYPLCTAVLAGLRRRGALGAPLHAVIGDVDPHRMWFAPGVDLHVVATPADMQRARQLVPWARVEQAAPAVDPAFQRAAKLRRPACAPRHGSPAPRVLVTGGAWGAGDLLGIVDSLRQQRPTWQVTVACGHNAGVHERLASRRDPYLQAVGFTDALPELMAAADVIVATGPGMTFFEAQASHLPIVMAGVIPGHGRRSAAAAELDGSACWARELSRLPDVITHAWGGHVPDMHATPPSTYPMPQPISTIGSRRRRGVFVASGATAVALAVTGALPISAFAHDMRSAARFARHPLHPHLVFEQRASKRHR